MTDTELRIAVGGLLHDIGKVLYRSGDRRKHSVSGADFLKEEAGIQDKDIIDMVRCHHADALREADLREDSPAYIVYLADNIAAATDRRSLEGEEKGFDPRIPLDSIFNILNGNHQHLHYHPEPLDDRSGINMPTDKAVIYDESFYNKMRADILDALKGINAMNNDYVNSLLCLLEAYFTYLPSSTATHERADISLYDHVKLTAAYAGCIYLYLEEQGIRDYKTALWKRGKDFYEQKAFRLVSMDISGIQKFIYTIHSEDALKTLRSRSFYLEILMEHMIDQVLEAIGLSRANLIYSGGGHCYILSPNTEQVKTILEEQRDIFNRFFMEQFDVALYVAFASVPCSARELENDPRGSYAAMFTSLSRKLSDQKLRRYTPDMLIQLNQRKAGDSLRECRVCKTSARLTEDDICGFCSLMKSFSSGVLYKDFFTVFEGNRPGAIPLPGGRCLAAQNEGELRKTMEGDDYFVRTYGKNRFYTGKAVTTRLWVGDYTRKGTTTDEYAKASTGIKRIGVLRADVDNLGHAFVAGFDSTYTSLSRTASFSRQISLFFKHHINEILANSSYSIAGQPSHERAATIVYSGGDDLFIIGAWDDILELAVDVSDKLEEYSQGTLTISAGIGIYDEKFPLSVSAEETADLEEASKKYPEKNAITLFTEGSRYPTASGEKKGEENHTYHWKELKEKVIGEKYALLSSFLANFDERGNSFLYRMLELIRGMEERINLARFAYTLARLAPPEDEDKEKAERYSQFSRTMYAWVQNKKDRKELVTAILLYVYLHRDRKKEE